MCSLKTLYNQKREFIASTPIAATIIEVPYKLEAALGLLTREFKLSELLSETTTVESAAYIAYTCG